jgi:hypothetical protein
MAMASRASTLYKPPFNFRLNTMKFDRRLPALPVTLTQRKAAAFARKQANERNRYPLFAEHVAGEQHSLDDEAAATHYRERGCNDARFSGENLA